MAARGFLRALSTQFCRQQWRRDWRSQRHRVQNSLPERPRSRCHLDHTLLPSPQVDFGYDVSDYENIDPMYGTLDDFDKLQKTAKAAGIKIILDFVVNHTSDKHKWFIDSAVFASTRNTATGISGATAKVRTAAE